MNSFIIFRLHKLVVLGTLILCVSSLIQMADATGRGHGRANDESSGTVPTVTVKSLTITTDHGVLRNASTTFRATGNIFPSPEYLIDQKGGATRQTPITQKWGTKVELNMVLKCSKAGYHYSIVGASSESCLDFSFTSPGGSTGSTGGDDTIHLVAANPLPSVIKRILSGVQWTISIKKAGTTAWKQREQFTTNHRIYCLSDAPDQTCSTTSGANVSTVKRMEALTSTSCAGGQGTDYTIAKKVQVWRDNSARSGVGTAVSTCFKTGAFTPNDLWALLDPVSAGGTTAQCAAGAQLMEVAMRLLGINATYYHVLAGNGTWTAGSNLYHPYLNPCLAPSRATCPYVTEHGSEELWLDFGNAGNFTGLNEGDGVVRVGPYPSRYYATWTEGNIVGKAGDTRTNWTTSASHGGLSVLRQLTTAPINDFQLWTYSPTPTTRSKCIHNCIAHLVAGCLDRVDVP